MDAMTVVVLGGGQLACELERAEWPELLRPKLLTRAEVDITQRSAVEHALANASLVINAAAYTAVDKAEVEQELAYRVNAEAPGTLAEVCARVGAPLLHISTDYVFDGTKSTAYVEDDPTAPLGVYGASKLRGEQLVRAKLDQHWIVRTSWVVSAFGNNFVKTMLRLASQRGRLRVVADQFGRPTPTKILASALVSMATRYLSGGPSVPWGTYHCAGAGRATWHELASKVVELQALYTNCRPPVDAISTADYPTSAKRPANSELDTTKLERALGEAMAPWQAGVEDIISELLGRPRSA